MGASASTQCVVKNRLGRPAELAIWPSLGGSDDRSLPEDSEGLLFEGSLGQGLEQQVSSDSGAEDFWVAVRATLAEGSPAPSSASSSSRAGRLGPSRASNINSNSNNKKKLAVAAKDEATGTVQRSFLVRLPASATLELRDYGGPGLARICREGSTTWEVPSSTWPGAEVWAELDRRRGRQDVVASASTGSSPASPSGRSVSAAAVEATTASPASSQPSPSAPARDPAQDDRGGLCASSSPSSGPLPSRKHPASPSSPTPAATAKEEENEEEEAVEVQREASGRPTGAASAPPASEPTPSMKRHESCCPISHEPFQDPVLASDGFTYERRCIEEWIAHRGLVSPMAGGPMRSGALVPNLVMRAEPSRPPEAQEVGDEGAEAAASTATGRDLKFYGEHLAALSEMFPEVPMSSLEAECRQLLAEGVEDLDRCVRRLLAQSSDAVSLAPVCCNCTDPGAGPPPGAGSSGDFLEAKDHVREAWSEEQKALFEELVALEVPPVRARKALELGAATELEEAVLWLELHQEDAEIDVPQEALEERETHQLALDVMRIATVPAAHRLACFQALHGILGRILKDPESQRLRQIRLKNEKFRQQVGRFRPAVRLLRSVGFQRGEYWASATEKEACLEFKLPVDSDNPISKRFVRAFSLLEEVLSYPDDYMSSIGEAQPEVSAFSGASGPAAGPGREAPAPAPASVEEILDGLDADAESRRRELRAQLHERRVRDPRGFQEAMKAAGRTPNKVVVDIQQRPSPAEEEAATRLAARSGAAAGAGGQHRPLDERYPGQRHFNLQDIEAMRIEDAIATCPSYASDYAARKGSATNYLDLVARSYDPGYLGRKAVDESNYFRASEKKPPLKWCQPLATIAEEHAQQMARGEMPFSHKGFDERVRRYPFAYFSAAENLAYNSGVADAARVAVDGWIKSPGHRKNLLGDFDLCGVGVARSTAGHFFFTQLFARSGAALC